MSDGRWSDAVPRLVRLLARRMEEFLEGDELALETLPESLEEEGFTAEDVHAAIAALRGLAGAGAGAGWVAGHPGDRAARVLSREERETLSTEAWGYLLGLKTRGALDAGQFERVLDVLAGSPDRPVSVETARDVASRVVMAGEHEGGGGPHGDQEVAH